MQDINAFDFDELDTATACETPFEFEIVHPVTKDGLGVFLSVIGTESATFQDFTRQEGNRARRKAFEAERKGKVQEPSTIEDDEETIIRAVAATVTGWRTVIDGKSEPVIVIGGERLSFTRENAAAWMRRFRWVRGQVAEATGDIANFIKG